jgi:probable phosphoglycerate mutase
VIVIENFREMNVGDLEGQKPTAALWDFHDRTIASWFEGSPETCFPGGENLNMLVARARTGMVEILAEKQDRNILLVGHGGIFSCSLAALIPEIDPLLPKTRMGNCSVTEILGSITNSHFEGRVISYASTAHLSGSAAQLAPGSPE